MVTYISIDKDIINEILDDVLYNRNAPNEFYPGYDYKDGLFQDGSAAYPDWVAKLRNVIHEPMPDTSGKNRWPHESHYLKHKTLFAWCRECLAIAPQRTLDSWEAHYKTRIKYELSKELRKDK